MSSAPLQITDAECAVLEALWDDGPQTIRDLTMRLYPSVSVSDYATVQKLLERLEAKSCVTRDRSGHAHVFRATRHRSDLIGSQLQQVANKLCDGSLAPVLMHLVQASKLSKSDRAMLRRLLADAENKKSSATKRSP
jgi:BlaI family penicillinase repressor